MLAPWPRTKLRRMRAWPGLIVLGVPLALGCEGPLLERSCAGEPVELCAPYEHSVVASASVTPNELPVADFSMTARVQVELERCPDAPAPHAVELLAVVPADDPSDVRITSLVTLRDGRDGDLVEGDGIIDVAIANPLLLTVPPETDILLRFTPRSTASRGCAGEDLEIPYRTGPFRSMD